MKPTTLAIIIVILLIPIIALMFTNRSNSTNSGTASPTPSAVTTPDDAVSARKVVLSTTEGDITLNLFPDDAPAAVKNFVTLGKRGYYDNLVFHRVIKDFMIQSGDPTGTGSGGESIYGQYFKTEITSHQFVAGILGAARTSQMDTNGSQFFITSVDYHSLDNQYTAFGQVADEASLVVVRKINAVATDENDKPLQEVKITKFTIVE